MAFAHQKAGRLEEAVLWFRRALLENPGAAWAERFHAVAHAQRGDLAAGRASIDRLRRAHPGITPEAVIGDMPVMSRDLGARRDLYLRAWSALGFRP